MTFTTLFIIQFCCTQVQHANAINADSSGFNLQFDFMYADADFLTGKKDYYTEDQFIEIPKNQAYREDMFLLKDTYYWFNKMYEAAKKDGINMKIISATRTFTEQQWIWDDKWEKRKNQYKTDKDLANSILEYSAMPGTSRHHWGTDIDLNSQNPSYYTTETGKKFYNWMLKHADAYGFCQTYDEKVNRTSGYKEEKWHWSFYPISNALLKFYEQKVTYTNIRGFKGDTTAEEIDVIKNYVLSVSNGCS
ncbi:MAG: M15 family metallopeptidase [Chitinophagales bacterium]